MSEKDIVRLKEIINIAYKLKWISPPDKTSYPLMQLSEVEKCMLAMVDDFELSRLIKWDKDVDDGKFVPMSEREYFERESNEK